MNMVFIVEESSLFSIFEEEGRIEVIEDFKRERASPFEELDISGISCSIIGKT